jgi:Ca2+-binding EF-hand superfamily protein
MGKSAKKEKQ